MKTLIISSSLSERSLSNILCKKVADQLKIKGVNVTIFDAREAELKPYGYPPSKGMQKLAELAKNCNNIIFGMGVHNYAMSDSLKIIIDNCLNDNSAQFFGILCAAGGPMSYLVPQQVMQSCMNQWRMIPLPRVVYATKNDFNEGGICNQKIIERLDLFVEEFVSIGKKLI